MQRLFITLMLLALPAGCSRDPVSTTDVLPAPAFVGSQTCAGCHESQYEAWRGSHHQLAMQTANASSVLGDFDEASFDYFGQTSRFFKRGDAFFVNTPGADGAHADFRITHAFGVAPLQQYLVEGERGRKHALTTVWDTRPEADGGQRWYHLQPQDAVTHADLLHWTGRFFTWNSMCAECHSTDLQANYDIASDAFDTTFSEISVGCEACHGPGSKHIALARNSLPLDETGFDVDLNDRGEGVWQMNMSTGIAQLSSSGTSQQTESCGRCHARRAAIAADYEYGQALSHTHSPALLDQGLYHADGRILEEVYVYGSFRQSKMFAAGVTCSDCHNPHSGTLHAGPDPNQTCQQCHLPATFATAKHNPARVGDCVSCHMPATTYMGVDARRDHSFRLPDTQNDPAHYGAVIAAGRTGAANGPVLEQIAQTSVPAIVRATLLTLLSPLAVGDAANSLTRSLGDKDPLVRIAALRALRQQDPARRLSSGVQLLRDGNRGVRIEAAQTYLGVANALSEEDVIALSAALDEYRQSLRINASMPETAAQLAELESRLGNALEADRLYAHALAIGDQYASIQHAYGLFMVRKGQADLALAHLRRASEIQDDVPRYVYVYGVALNSMGQPDQALRVLEQAHQRFDADFEIAWALATIYRDRGELERAMVMAGKLKKGFPQDAQVRALAQSLGD